MCNNRIKTVNNITDFLYFINLIKRVFLWDDTAVGSVTSPSVRRRWCSLYEAAQSLLLRSTLWISEHKQRASNGTTTPPQTHPFIRPVCDADANYMQNQRRATVCVQVCCSYKMNGAAEKPCARGFHMRRVRSQFYSLWDQYPNGLYTDDKLISLKMKKSMHTLFFLIICTTFNSFCS